MSNVRYTNDITEQSHTVPYSFGSTADNKSLIRHYIVSNVENIKIPDGVAYSFQK